MGTGILKPGDKALDFNLVEAASGQLVGPADFAGKQSIVLLFYRGMWRPFCLLHLGKVRRVYEQIKQLDAEVLTVSIDSLTSLRKYQAKTETPFPMLSDEKGEVILKYGVKNDWTPYKRGIPHPSIYIIDRAGIVRFVEVRQNYVLRVKMSTILDELQKLA